MQGKGVVRFFLILMSVVTLAQFLLVIPTRKVEKNADEFASAAAAAAPADLKDLVYRESVPLIWIRFHQNLFSPSP